MNCQQTLFTSSNKKLYEGTPYFSIKILFDMDLFHHDEISIIVNRETGQINLSQAFRNLQEMTGIRLSKNNKNFADWKYLLETTKYIDAYSVLHYGHPHFTYQGKHIYNTDEDINSVNKKTTFKPELVTKGKISSTSVINESPEIFGENYNGYPNECKGQYGDFHLLIFMMDYLSPKFQIIRNEFSAYVLPLLSNQGETFMSVMQKGASNLILKNTDTEIIQSSSALKDTELHEIMKNPTTHKGKLAERFVMNKLKPFIDDIEDCSSTKKAMDLYSKSLSTRFEIKCHSVTTKKTEGLNKFHRDCHEHELDTNWFVYIDFSEKSDIKTHIEINPCRMYINGDDFDERTIEFMKTTIINSNMVHITGNATRVDSNLIINDTRTVIQETMKGLLKTELIKQIKELIIDAPEPFEEYYNENEIREKQLENMHIEVKSFLNDNNEFKTGYYSAKSYDKYQKWAVKKQCPCLPTREFNKIMAEFCEKKRIVNDLYTGENNRLFYWILKQE